MIAAFIAFAVQATQAPASPMDQRAVRDRCSAETFSQVAFGACLQRKAAESEKVLRAAAARALTRIDDWDEDASYVARAKAALTRSASAFVTYRRQQCELAWSMAGGAIGTAHVAWRLACVYQLNMERAAMLDGLTRDLPRTR